MRENDWNDGEFRSEAHRWVTARLEALGTPVTGEIQVIRVRPWSVTHRAPTAAGPRWFKANITGCRYEAALADALARIAPGATLAPLAVDTSRGWMLTADAGPTLRDSSPSHDRWVPMLQAYASLQRATVPFVGELEALGVPKQRISMLPSILDRQEGIDSSVRAQFGEWCAELAADGIPAALQHDDLHDNNVFADLRVFDWGDASTGHPFGSLLVTLNTAQDILGVASGAPELLRLRDAYLEPWTDLAPAAALRRSATLACRVTRLSRALSWQRALAGAALPIDDAFRAAPAAWLAEITAPTTV